MSVRQTQGFIDAHSHLRSTSLASHGIADCLNLEDALLRFTAMSSVNLEDDSFVAAADLVAAGITGVQAIFHTFADQDGYLTQLREVCNGLRRSKIRALVILAVTDQAEFLPTALTNLELLPPWLHHTPGLKVEQLPEVLELVRTEFPEIQFGIGPVGAQWCSDHTLGLLGELAQDKLRIHSHLLESPRQRNWAAEDPIDRLSRHGLLGPKTSLAHGVWCNADDLKKIKDAGAQLVTCPGSNRLLNAGTADLGLWQAAKVDFGFGLDSSAEEIRAFEIAKSAMDPATALRTLTAGGISATELECDKDIVVWKNFSQGSCESVTIRGELVFASGELSYQQAVDEAKARIQDQMQADSQARKSRMQLIDGLMPRYQQELDRCLG